MGQTSVFSHTVFQDLLIFRGLCGVQLSNVQGRQKLTHKVGLIFQRHILDPTENCTSILLPGRPTEYRLCGIFQQSRFRSALEEKHLLKKNEIRAHEKHQII